MYTKVLEILIGALLSGMILLGFAAVVARFLLTDYVSPYWAEEVIRYSFIWSVFLAPPLVIRWGANLELDIVAQWVSPRARRVISLFNAAAILIVLAGSLSRGQWRAG